MYLEEIIENIQLESDKFECKSTLNREDVVGWLKTIAGFVNAGGGDFYIDVEDKTNKLIGFEIYRDLCEKTGIPFSMYHMNLETLKNMRSLAEY